MPFRLFMRRKNHYTVSSKNLFVLPVEFLDKQTIECTLSAQSNGRECLNNACQRLGLQQPEFFGLKFSSKRGWLQWVDLDRPLKKQLDRQGCCGQPLKLGVMFFVPSVNVLHDDVTRYHYFLQLKSDILAGNLPCNDEQAVLFASYSLQAEFGDHDPERHTIEYLKNFGLLPNEVHGQVEELLDRVIEAHRRLQGVSHALAEVHYIQEAQTLPGYGLHCFSGKTDKECLGDTVLFGVSLMGIHLWFTTSKQPPQYFAWEKITNLSHHKKQFGIEHRDATKALHTYFEDSHMTKYVWKTCIHQHAFYVHNEGILGSPSEHPADMRQPFVSPPEEPAGNIRQSVENIRQNATTPVCKVNIRAAPTQQSIVASRESLDGLGVYHTDGQYSERLPATPPPPQTTVQVHQNGSPHRSASDVSLHHQSVPRDLRYCGIIPKYRQAPDYDTAVRIKYGAQSEQQPSTFENQNHQTSLQQTVGEVQEHNGLVKSNEFLSAPSLPACLPPISSKHHSSTPELSQHETEATRAYMEAVRLLYQSDQNHINDLQRPRDFQRPLDPQQRAIDLQRNIDLQRAIELHKSIELQRALEIQKTLELQKSIELRKSLELQRSMESPKLLESINRMPRFTSADSLKNPVLQYSGVFESRPSSHAFPISSSSPHLGASTVMAPSASGHVFSPTPEHNGAMGPMLSAAMNGLCISRPSLVVEAQDEIWSRDDNTIKALELKLANGQLFQEFEQIPKRKSAEFLTSSFLENAQRNRFRDVLPYEENRVCLTPTIENRMGYINASHVAVCVGLVKRQWIAAQGPLPNTLYSFWQMIWEHNSPLIVMLTEVQEQGRDKCFPYWPQEDGNKLQIGEFQILRQASVQSPTYVTCSLSLCHVPTGQARTLCHVQYTDWPDHACPEDLQGFIAFMNEVDALRRHCEPGPITVHCSAGVGRSGVVILCDILVGCLDHNQPIDVPGVLTYLRLQRMLLVQTLAQYKFVYTVLIQYLKNARLI